MLSHRQARGMKRYKNTRGFTLPELLITLGVIAIALSTAVPGISSMIKNNALANQLNTLVTNIHYARAEAVKRDVRVILAGAHHPMQQHPPVAVIPESGKVVI